MNAADTLTVATLIGSPLLVAYVIAYALDTHARRNRW